MIFAVENNRLMLEILRRKCQKFLRTDPSAGGIITLKQDITSLFGLEDDYFDFVTLSNVLYAVQDAAQGRIAFERIAKGYKIAGLI